MGRKVLALEDIPNAKTRSELQQYARDVGARLAAAKCPTHGKGPINVRVHFDAAGTGDLKYESCCEKLGETISKLI